MFRALVAVAVLALAGCDSAGPAAHSAPPAACPDGALELLGLGPVHRPLAGGVIIRPSRELLADDVAMRAHLEAAAELSAATGIAFRVSADEDGDVILFTRVDPDLPSTTSGDAHQQLAGDVVVSGTLRFRTMYHAGRRPIVVHEMLHWLGLPNHSTTVGDVMCPCSEDPNRGISAREASVLRYLQTLPPGSPATCR